jgi:transcription elongation factor GreB
MLAVSKAFTDEEAAEPAPVVPARAPLPLGVPNYVTAHGLALLHAELDALRAERADDVAQRAGLAQRRAQLEERIASAELVPAPSGSRETIRFGATVTVEGAAGVRSYRIVGVDEADAACGDIAFVSPLARALLGRAVGDAIRLRAPRGEEELEVLAVDYAPDA